MKQEHYIFGLIGIGAIIVLYWLYQESQAAAPAAASAAPDLSSPAAPVYPNAQPIQLGNVTINDTPTPAAQNYNMQPNGQQIPTVSVTPGSDCGCEDNDCEAAGAPVTTQSISQTVVDSNAKNLMSFTAKTQSGVEAARLMVAAPAAATAAAPAAEGITFGA
jgi:hypothetical protein